MKYKDVLPINAHISTSWLVEFANSSKHLHIWHKDAKIEDIVEAVKVSYPDHKFTVSAVNVGEIVVHHINSMYANGRKLNQDMEIVI